MQEGSLTASLTLVEGPLPSPVLNLDLVGSLGVPFECSLPTLYRVCIILCIMFNSNLYELVQQSFLA